MYLCLRMYHCPKINKLAVENGPKRKRSSRMKKQSSTMSWVIVMFFTLFMTIYTFNLVVYPACAVETMALYGIEQTGLTTFASVTSVVGLVAGFVFGPLIDKKGSRGVILVAMIIGIALFVVRAFVTSFGLAIYSYICLWIPFTTAVSAYAYSFIYTSTGTYDSAVWLALGCSVTAAVLIFFAGSYAKKHLSSGTGIKL